MKVFYGAVISLMCMTCVSFANEQKGIRFDFEEGAQGWDVPEWANAQDDHVCKTMELSDENASSGKKSLKLNCDFSGDMWAAGLLESGEGEMDLSGYKRISVDVFLPSEAKSGTYQARIILTAGPWWRIESKDVTPLKLGKWTTVTATLAVNERGQLAHWECKTKESCVLANIKDVKNVEVRVECDVNASQGAAPYKGPVYIDNVVIE